MQLAAYMERESLTDAAMAERIGCSRVSVGRYRRKLEIPSSNTVKAIVAATEGAVTANELLEISSEAAQ